MAIDIRNSRSGLDRCKYYKGEYVNKMKLTKDAEPSGVFYSKDVTATKLSNFIDGSTKGVAVDAKIVTTDYIPDLTVDYFVLYDDSLYIVADVEITDILDSTKQFKRHAYEYVISLRR